jgi:hypothetical protein
MPLQSAPRPEGSSRQSSNSLIVRALHNRFRNDANAWLSSIFPKMRRNRVIAKFLSAGYALMPWRSNLDWARLRGAFSHNTPRIPSCWMTLREPMVGCLLTTSNRVGDFQNLESRAKQNRALNKVPHLQSSPGGRGKENRNHLLMRLATRIQRPIKVETGWSRASSDRGNRKPPVQARARRSRALRGSGVS